MTAVQQITKNLDKALYQKTIEVRWADCDANRHMRHTAYSDLSAHTRVAFLSSIGLTPEYFSDNNIGPVLFREETEFRSEVNMGEMLTVTVEAGEPTGFTKSVQVLQNIYKADGQLSAIHKAVFGWMDLGTRKIIELPDQIKQRFPIEAKADNLTSV